MRNLKNDLDGGGNNEYIVLASLLGAYRTK